MSGGFVGGLVESSLDFFNPLSTNPLNAIGLPGAMLNKAVLTPMQEQADAMKQAQRDAQAAADKQIKELKASLDKQQAKVPNIANMIAGNMLAARGGVGSTMITGGTSGATNLGKTTLLGIS